MTARKAPPVRALREHPDLVQLKRQAKELLKAISQGDADAIAEVNAHYPGAGLETFALHDAQLVLARAYGFASWPKLKAYVDGVTVRRLAEAVRAGDLDAVNAMIAVRPELVHLDLAENDEHQALHHAVLRRQPAIVRVLMQHGANARKGIWPHRDATSPLTLARERGDTEIVAIIQEEERRRSRVPVAGGDIPVPPELADAFQRGDETAAIAALEAHPEFIHAAEPRRGITALHWAAASLWDRMTAWLLDRGADVKARTTTGQTALDLVGDEADLAPADTPGPVMKIAEMLLGRGAERTARWAVAVGDANWLRARHAEGALTSQMGLLKQAVRLGRADIVRVLLDLGLDPDEAGKVGGLEEVVPTWGEPLRACASNGDLAMAELLLKHGANPNTNVYASSCALSEAHSRHDAAMIALLERHGGRLTPAAIAGFGFAEQAAKLLENDAAGKTPEGLTGPGSSVAQDLLWGAIESASIEIVKMALERIDWPRDDSRWHGILENGLYLGPESDRPRHLEGFRLALSRSEPNVRSKKGATLLHDVAASRGGLTATDRVAYASLLLDAGARLDLRDNLLESTPLGWACRWGRVELVDLFLKGGADPVEADAPSWARPMAWAEKMGRHDVLELLTTSEADR